MGVPGGWTETGLRQHCTGTIFYVDPNYPGVSDQRDGTDPTDPLTTVAAALTKCEDYRGDVIVVMANNAWKWGDWVAGAGQYTTAIIEEVTVDVHGVRIVGLSPSGAVGVVWQAAQAGGTCITVHAMDVLIEGFAFQGCYTGPGLAYAQADAISAVWGGAFYGENLTVRNCHFSEYVDTAIELEFSWYAHIHNNVFDRCAVVGIYADPAGSHTQYCNIHDNLFTNCGDAIALEVSDYNQIYRNSIYNITAQAGGLSTDEGINLTNGDYNMVFDNYFSCDLPAGANGDWDDLNTAGGTDAWVNNHCMNGDATTAPA